VALTSPTAIVQNWRRSKVIPTTLKVGDNRPELNSELEEVSF
jgi:hypothetical protein